MGVFVHTLLIIMPGLNARGLQSKLLITPLLVASVLALQFNPIQIGSRSHYTIVYIPQKPTECVTRYVVIGSRG